MGDVLRRADVQRLVDLAPGLTVVNYYGSTETQRAVSYHVVDPAAEQKEIIPLGRGIPGVQLWCAMRRGRWPAMGEVGEIWLRSPHLAAGYLGDAALTAARFVANPWTGQARDRLYRTGDLGRYRPDGEVEPLGRADQQVKVRGFRVELGEVESALAAHAAVKEAAVIARETEGGDRRLVAYWVPRRRRDEPDAAALRAHLKALLPEYMVPSAYVRLDAAAADGERQAGPPRAAGARIGRGGRASRRAAHADGGDPGAALGRGPAHGIRRRGRRLLRARRALAAGDAAPGAGAERAGCRRSAARALRGAHGGGAGRRGWMRCGRAARACCRRSYLSIVIVPSRSRSPRSASGSWIGWRAGARTTSPPRCAWAARSTWTRWSGAWARSSAATSRCGPSSARWTEARCR